MSTYFWSLPQNNVKNLNKYNALDLIRFTSGGVSRVELAHRLGLTRAGVTNMVSELAKCGIVKEAESRIAPSGRRPVVLEINADRGRVAGIDIGATHVTVVLADFAAHIIKEAEQAIDISQGPDFCLSFVDKTLRKVLSEAGLGLDEIKAIGVGVPGPVVSEAGTVSGPPIMPGWDGYPIREHFEALWGCPVQLSNDAELGALGEWAYGAGRGERYLAYIKVGTGIGAGLLLDGQIYRGVTGCAGEIGHITIDENGPLCSCSNRGCLEAFAGGKAIGIQAAEAVRRGVRTQLATMGSPEELTANDVIQAARSGDHAAQQMVRDAGAHLGTALSSLVNLFNPGMVVVGGGVAQSGDLLLEPIRQAIRERSLIAASKEVRVTASLLGRRSSAMGAVVQALTVALRQIADRKEAGMPVEKRV